MAAPDPFKTEKPISQRGKKAFEAIELRLSQLSPGIKVKEYIGQNNQPGKTALSSLVVHEDTLDGIYFRTDSPKKLAGALDRAKDHKGKQAFASMKVDPDHWALRKSFGKTVGTGWREIWRPGRYKGISSNKSGSKMNPLMGMRFGSAGVPFLFTALHCAVDNQTGKCNIHIDESGFVMDLPFGVTLTPDTYQHTVNELLLKTEFRDWLCGKTSNETAKDIIREVIRRISIQFPNASNGYAGLEKTINSFRRPTSVDGAIKGLVLGAARIVGPIGVSAEIYSRNDLILQGNMNYVEDEFSITLTLGGRF